MKHKHGAATPHQERRVHSGRIEVRSIGGKKKIVGYASVFAPSLSSDLGGWFEEIHPNAFDDCLASNPDVRALWNHDPNHVLGRTTAGTLQLSTDSRGLKYSIDPPDTNLANDLLVSLDRGDVDQSSFGFFCTDDVWRQEGDKYIRTVLKAELFDVSPVTFPAYPDATSGVRASLRNAPAAIREKIKARGQSVDCEDNPDGDGCKERKSDADMEGICEDDPDADGCDEYNAKRGVQNKGQKRDGVDTSGNDCGCDCPECSEEFDCTRCSNTRCERDECAACPAQMRAAHLALLLRKLR